MTPQPPALVRRWFSPLLEGFTPLAPLRRRVGRSLLLAAALPSAALGTSPGPDWKAIEERIRDDQHRIVEVEDGEGAGYRAINHRQQTEARWTGAEVQITPAAADSGNGRNIDWSLRFSWVGYGDGAVTPVDPPSGTRMAGRRLELLRPGVVEWYENGDAGLEHGFTLASPPPGHVPGSGLAMILGVETALVPRLDGARSVAFEQDGVALAGYRNLMAFDAAGRQLTTRMEVRPPAHTPAGTTSWRLALHVDDRAAAYPIIIDPTIVNELAKVTASDGGLNHQFGRDVALSGDYLVVGASLANAIGADSGAAYVFERNAGGVDNWGQVKKLLGSTTSAADRFGFSVGISGQTVIVGAPNDDGMVVGTDLGNVFFFERNQGGIGNWGESKLLVNPALGSFDQFGRSVSISGDTAIVGAHGDDDGAPNAGAAYIFERNLGGAGNWGLVEKLIPSGAGFDTEYGNKVALSADTALVAALFGGGIYAFERNLGGPSAWGEVKSLRTVSDPAAIAIRGDTAVIGVAWNDDAGTDAGKVFVYDRNEGGTDNWGETKGLFAPTPTAGENFGESVATDGGVILVGAAGNDFPGLDGALYLFARDLGGTSNWGNLATLISTDRTLGDRLGAGASLDGGLAVGGAPAPGFGNGAAYIFEVPSDTDWGDAPDPSYPTLLASNGARHTVVAGFFLGSGVDTEADGQPDASATGDDGDGNDDEDGVVFTSALVPGVLSTVDVTASMVGVLDAWIDFDGNGSWADAGEKIFTAEALSAGVNNLSFTVPGTATAGTKTARFRLTTAGVASFDGLAPDGEVEDYEVTIDLPSIAVTKTASPTSVAEPGGSVTFSAQVQNTGTATVSLTSLSDDIHGNLDGQGTCSVPQTIAVSGSYSCSFTATVNGNAGDSETDTVTASGTSAGVPVSAQDSATVTVTDLLPTATVTKTASPTTVDEPGGSVTFTVDVENTGTAESLSLTALSDDIHGDLNGQGTCAVPQTIAIGATYSCSFTATVSGNAGDTETDTVTATLSDDDGNSITPSDSATVTITDVASSIAVTKTASPTSVDEPGGSVTFTVQVDNTGTVDDVTITSLSDDVHGDLNGQGTCAVPQTITAGNAYSCSFTVTVNGNAGDSETDTVTASGTDDDGNPVSAQDSATVTVTDVPPTATVTKTASPTSVEEPGGSVTFTVDVQNTGTAESLSLTALSDDVHGDLDGQGTCSVPQTVATGATYSCSFTATVSGVAGDSETDTVTATLSDDDGNTITPSDSATVTVTGTDWGDAPDPSYPTLLASNGARHTIVAGFYLGAGVDAEGDGQPDATATGDDGDGNDDEDGVVFTSTLVPGTSASVDVTASLAGVLDAWIDFGGNGSWADAGEKIFTAEPLSAGANNLSFAVPGTATAGTKTARFRLTTAGVADPTGLAPDGEVEDYQVTVDVPSIAVNKTASPTSVAEPGGSVAFSVQVTNTGTATISLASLTDDVHGDLDGQGTCAVPQTIAVSGSYSCSFSATVSGNAGDSETDTVTASGTSAGLPVTAMDSATVTVTDVLPTATVTKTASPTSVAEPGGSVTFTVQVQNTGTAESLSLTALSDDIHGGLNGQGTCSVPQAIAAGSSYSCSFTATVNGNAGDTETDTVTATLSDDDGNSITPSDSATVTITDVASSIAVTKTASPTSVDEPGGSVTFTVQVQNSSAVDDVTITSLTDDVHGNLDGQGSCSVPQTITASNTYSCSFAATVSGNAGDTETDTVAASGTDDDGNPVSAQDSATVTVTDVLPTAAVTKTASPTSIDEPGGSVTFTVDVQNTGTAESIDLTALSDDIHGDLDGQGSCSVPQTVATGATYSCSFSATVTGVAGDSETDTVTATLSDDDGNTITPSDSATVTITGTDWGDAPDPLYPTLLASNGARHTIVAGFYLGAGVDAEGDGQPDATATGDDGDGNDDEDGVVFTSTLVPGTSASVDVTASLAGVLDAWIDFGGNGSWADAGEKIFTAEPLSAGANNLSFAVPGTATAGTKTARFRLTTAGVADPTGLAPDGEVEDYQVTVDVPSIAVNKTASPTSVAEPGGSVAFSVQVTNTGTATISLASLTDDVHGDLDGQGTCAVPQTIAVSGSYSCSFSATVSGNAGDSETDTVTASGTSAGLPVTAMDSATVTVTDVLPAATVTKTASPTSVAEPGGSVTFTVQVQNTGTAESLSLTALSDDIHGGLNGQGTCSVPQAIAAGSSYSCSFTATVNGNAGDTETDTVTATLSDDDGNSITPSDSATVTITDVASSIAVTKTASPMSVDEPGGSVTFTVQVDNTGTVDDVTITSLSDDVHGDLNGQGTCAVPQTITAGNAYSCSFTVTVNGNAGDSETDTVTASGTDDDGNPVSAQDSATVTVNDVLPTATVTKTAAPTTVAEPGGSVTFTLDVENTGTAESLSLTSLVDDIHGDLDGQGTCAVPQTIATGATYSCTFTVTVSGVAGDSETDTVTATLSDDDGNSITPSDSATVTVVGTDWGDAPDPLYPTLLASNGARHTIVAGFYLGAGVDAEGDGQPDATATGDDGDGNDDEDGVVFTSTLVPGTSASVDVTASLAGVLDAWIDFDGNGSWADAGEKIFTAEPLSAGASNLSFAVPGTATAGTKTARFRLTTAGVADSTGLAPDGEVEDYQVTVDVPSIAVNKTASPTSVAEPGGSVAFSVQVTNTGTATVSLTSLTDDVHGNLDGQGTCAVPQTIAVSGSYSCSFSATVSGNAGDSETDTVTASGTSAGLPVTAMDSATVTVTDVLPAATVTKTASPTSVAEPGGSVTFTVQVQNTGTAESLSLTALSDDIHGGLNGQGTCSVPQAIAAGSSYSCSFTATVNGNAGDTETDTVTATLADDDGNTITPSDSATVTITDVASSIAVTKTASPTSVDEPGGSVTFTVQVDNTGTVDDVTINSLSDDVHGDLDGQGTCSVPQTITAGGSYTCSFTATVNGNAGDTETDTVTASGTDDDSNPVSAQDSATVTVNDVAPAATVTKTASPTSIDEPGGSVTFTVDVQNTGTAESIDLTALSDDIHGDLNGQGTCSVPQTIATGTTYSCSFTATVNGVAGDSETDTVTATLADDDGNTITPSDSATVTITGTDWGDAPDPSYPTLLASNGARHTIVAGFYLGAGVDAEADGQPDATATGDDGDGNDDEDGVVFTSALVPGTSASVDVTASLAGVLDAWIDFDGNGSWTDAGEKVFDGEALSSGINSLSVTVPATASIGGTAARFRFTSGGVADPTGLASDGEVEDLQVAIEIPSISVTKTASPTSVAEPGGSVAFTVQVDNTGTASVSLASLVDDVHGDLNGQGDCAVPQTVAVSGFYQCIFSVTLSGNAGFSETDTVTASGTSAGVAVSAQDSATVTITDVAPAATVTKTASPTTVDEPGGTVTFSVAVANVGTAESLELTALVDDIHGDVNGQGDCSVPQTIAAGGSYGCSFTVAVGGNAGDTETDTVTATLSDDDGNTITPSDSATVTIIDVAPTATVTKTASPTTVAEPGGNVTFSVDVQNTGTAESLSLTALVDDIHGDLAGQGDCSVPQTIATGATYSCSFSVAVNGNAGDSETDTVTATLSDDDGNTITPSDSATVTITGTDWGDAPDPSYPTLLASNGARHTIVAGFYLGAGVDAEADGQPDATATGDDGDGNDDEGGVVFTSALVPGTSASVDVTASLAGVLDAWIDFDGNGSWADAGEKILDGEALGAGVNSLSFPVPSGVANVVFARFRLSSGGVSSYLGLATDGEVEDYQVLVDVVPPQVVRVASTPDTGDGEITACETARVVIDELAVVFSEAMATGGGPGAADAPESYLLIAPGADFDFDTSTCGGAAGDDTTVAIDGVLYQAGSPAPQQATARLQLAAPPEDEHLRLLVCGSVTDAVGNPLDGGDFSLDFRVDAHNLFANGHFDCDLAGWAEEPPGTLLISHAAVDADGSDDSGSARVDYAGTGSLALGQCFPVGGGETLRMGVRFRIDGAGDPDLAIVRTCSFFDGAACGGTEVGLVTEVDLVADSAGMFLVRELSAPIDVAGTAALCSVAVTRPSDDPAAVFFDRLHARSALFADGFESGDTSAWSASVP